MNILFLFCSLPDLRDDATLYSSLINEFKRQGHNVVYGYFGKNSPIGLYYRYWERKMFKASDYICVPLKGTINYIRNLYPWIPENRFRVCQFWQRPLDIVKSDEVRKKLGLEGKFVVIYGGSVGQAQRVDHMVNLAESVKEYDDIVFLLLGKGAKLNDIKQMVKDKGLVNFRFLDYMPQQEYLQLLSSCDAGLIILNEVHGSPNFPSKTASYFNLQVPVLAAIDNVTSYGQFLDETQTGLWSISGDVEAFKANLLKLYQNPDLCAKMKENELKYFSEKMTTEYACSVMTNHIVTNSIIK